MSPFISGETCRPNLQRRHRAGPRAWTLQLLASVVSLWGCTGEIPATPQDERVASRIGSSRGPASTPDAPGASAPSSLARAIAEGSVDGDPLRGGRLFDKFYEESQLSSFVPDDPETTALDGDGGPDGNGTLRDGRDAHLDNALGHSYRLKSFFGWDLRGAEGVYGPRYQNQPYVAAFNLLGERLSLQDVATLIVDGAAGVPAYGEILPEQDLQDLVAFVAAVREHELPRPSDIWQLDASAPKGYVLAAGGNAANGSAAIRASCSNCHGANGTSLLFDEGEHSLGTLARANAYEVWFKIVAGNPGSAMGSQLPAGEPGSVQAQLVLDVLAALCDRSAFPRGAASEADVGAGDLRCGSYLR